MRKRSLATAHYLLFRYLVSHYLIFHYLTVTNIFALQFIFHNAMARNRSTATNRRRGYAIFEISETPKSIPL